ncbi:MAG TPA: nickel-dependent lactate racemase [Pyrinomonadaceae bacterium]|nr:nickel-dependent lactate racemase [Pyrinomonadaceae bacterium]
MQLAYGRSSLSFSFDENSYLVLSEDSQRPQPLTDVEIGQALDSPIGSPPLEDLCAAGETVLIVVSDATRATASAQIVNLIVRRLIQGGIAPSHLGIIFATGIHRPVSPEEKIELVTPFIAQRVKTIDHTPFDPATMLLLGTTERGTPIELNRAVKDFSHVVVIGAIGFHYFAGFTGGRKSICPGLASARTIEATHVLALDFEKGGRRAGVETGRLDGNAVHEECERIAGLAPPRFAVNSVVDERGRAVKIYAGDWRASHRAGCAEYLVNHSTPIKKKREVVIVSCGGFPYDINLIQAHKALDMAAHACTDGGSIILLAECSDGLGRPDFLKWFADKDSRALELRLRDKYEVNGQTAWSWLTKAERYKIYLVSNLPDEDARRLRVNPARSVSSVIDSLDREVEGYILPRGAALLPRIEAST